MDKLDKIIREQVSRYTYNIINEDSLTGYENDGSEEAEPMKSEEEYKQMIIDAILKSKFEVVKKEWDAEIDFGDRYGMTIYYTASTGAWYDEGDPGDYWTPPSGGDLHAEDTAEIDYAKIDLYDEKIGEYVYSKEADDDILGALNKVADFDEFNNEYAMSEDQKWSYWDEVDSKYDSWKNDGF